MVGVELQWESGARRNVVWRKHSLELTSVFLYIFLVFVILNPAHVLFSCAARLTVVPLVAFGVRTPPMIAQVTQDRRLSRRILQPQKLHKRDLQISILYTSLSTETWSADLNGNE